MPDDAHGADDEICEIIITAPDPEWLADFTRRLVEDRLVAGSHQIESVRSIYRWNGEIHDTHEARVALRTRLRCFAAILERTLAEHQYVVPSVLALPVVDANPAYRRWVLDQTHSPL
jgi:periplasmic divalent cation tolerance protein